MADSSQISRWDYWRHAFRWWWWLVTVFFGLWGLFGNIRQEFISAERQEQWRLPVLFPEVPWYWLVVGFLVVTIIAILEGMFREHRGRMREARAEIEANKSLLEKISLRVIDIKIEGRRIEPPAPYIGFRVKIINCSAHPVSIESGIGGFITFDRRPIRGQLKRSSEWAINDMVNWGVGDLVFTIWPDADDAEFLAEHNGSRGMNYYYNLENLEFTIVGGNPASPKEQLLEFVIKGVDNDGRLI